MRAGKLVFCKGAAKAFLHGRQVLNALEPDMDLDQMGEGQAKFRQRLFDRSERLVELGVKIVAAAAMESEKDEIPRRDWPTHSCRGWRSF